MPHTNHVFETRGTQFSHHRLGEGVVGGLEQSKCDVICPVQPHASECVSYHKTLTNVPELPSIVETKLLGPYANHSPQGDQDGNDIRDHKLEFSVRTEDPCSRRCSLPCSSWGFSSTFGCTRSRVCCSTSSPLVIEAQRTSLPDGGRNRLREGKIGILE